MLSLPVCRLNPKAQLPTRGSEFAAGADLYACLDNPIVIKSHDRAIIPTGIGFAIPKGFYGRVAPRSGLAMKSGLHVGAGVADNDYRSDIRVVLFNHSDTDYTVEHGDRIAQIIITPYIAPEIEEVQVLPESVRGTDGFGSTGK